MYNEKITDHFMNPRHLGELADANGIGAIGDPGCGDFMNIYIKVEDGVIRDISFLCQGCPAAVASGSATTELAIGKTLQEAVQITDEMVSDHLGGLPEHKMHCSNLGIGALSVAIANHLGIDLNQHEESAPIIDILKVRARNLADQIGLLSTPVKVIIKSLPPGHAIGENSKRDCPIWKGKEGIIEAYFLNGIGQAFTPSPGDFEGEFSGVFDLDMEGPLPEPIKNRAIFIAVINAMCSHLEVSKQTIHCKNDEPENCACDFLRALGDGVTGPAKIALIGYQPRMAEAIAPRYHLRITDFDPDNIGREIDGILIEGEEKTDDVMGWCDFAVVTGSTIVNGTID
jgi:NifU-like protein involved in Fe-S cluster formation